MYETCKAIAIPIFQNESNTRDATILQITNRFILIGRVNKETVYQNAVAKTKCENVDNYFTCRTEKGTLKGEDCEKAVPITTPPRVIGNCTFDHIQRYSW